MDCPEVWVVAGRFANGDRFWDGDGKVGSEPWQPRGFVFDLGRSPMDPWEADHEVIAETPDAVVRPPRLHDRQGQPRKVRELRGEQPTHEAFVDVHLVGMHANGAHWGHSHA